MRQTYPSHLQPSAWSVYLILLAQILFRESPMEIVSGLEILKMNLKCLF